MRSMILLLLLVCPGVFGKCLTEYDRKLFPHWLKTGELADSRQEAIKLAGVSDIEIIGGRVAKGEILDPYTGRILTIGKDSIDADHVVSLQFAFKKGANCWSRQLRTKFANDPLNIIAVSASSNRKKGARVASYLPPNLAYCLEYIDRIQAIMNKYGLNRSKSDVRRFNKARKKCEKYKNGTTCK